MQFTYQPETVWAGKGYGVTDEDLKHLDPREALGEIERNARAEIHALNLDPDAAQIYTHALAEGYEAGWHAALTGIFGMAEVHEHPDA